MKVRFIVFALLLPALGFAAAQQGYPKLAPFQDIRWPGGFDQPPIISFEGRMYELLEIDELPIEEIVAFSLHRFGEDWDRRIAEDLVQVLSEIDTLPGKTVSMLVRAPGEEATLELTDVPMTGANRQAVMSARYPGGIARAVREPRDATPAEMLEDLERFEEALETQFAYLYANDFDYESEMAALRNQVEAGMSTVRFGWGLERILAGFIDGHAGVEGLELPENLEGLPPFLMHWAGERAVAVKPNRTTFFDAEHPYLVALDGVPLETWLDAASVYVTDGSPQLVRRRALRELYAVQFYRHDLGLPILPTLTVTLANEAGETVEQQVEVVEDWPFVRDPLQLETRILENNIGYLRLERMDDEAVADIRAWMPRFEGTEGLIIDVRGNGGGRREALHTLFPHLIQDEYAIVNVAKYRLAPQFEENHLASRFLYRADSSHWSASERKFVETFAASFEPEWSPPEEDFSAWHYFVISQGNAEPYTAPVVVLQDAGGFSATDIFLGALATLPNVTLMGEASSGGSANREEFYLPNTGLEVEVASMASFRPDGRLYDGRGVEPDIEVQPEPSFFLQGGEDGVLGRAVQHILSEQAAAD